MASHSNNQRDSKEAKSWIPVLLMFIICWPIGLVLLFRKLMYAPDRNGRQEHATHPYDLKREAAHSTASANTKPANSRQMDTVKLPSGQGLIIGGAAIATVFGTGTLSTLVTAVLSGNILSFLPVIFAPLGFCCAGLVMIYCGIHRSRDAKRFRKYLALIGRRDSIPVAQLAGAMPVSLSKAMNDLQEMLDKNYIPAGYLDYTSGLLMLTDEGLPEDQPEPEPAPAGMEREDAVLREIREINDAIVNPELSRKIDRVGEITGRIFVCLRENPNKEKQLRGFLSYYLPTTLKILRAYAQMEAQGIEGENITVAKARIERMMDNVVDGFEKQLDKLFQDDVLDITSDVTVLEQMLNKDGLSQGDGLQIGG